MVGTLWYGKEMKYKISPLDSLNEKPLYKQLEEQLAKYIAAHFPGDKLPAEREIAEKAGVNRETVRKAISAFIEKKLIHRSGKGTYISGHDSREQAEIHPLFLVGFQYRKPSRTLRFATFENLPAQKKFWKECTENFKKQTGNSIILEDVPQHINSPERYVVYLEEKKPDLIMLLSSSAESFTYQKLLDKLPREITENFENEKFIRIHDSNDEIMGKYCVPISFMPWGIFFNKNLADKYQLKDLSSTIREKGIDFSLKLARKHLPAEIKVTGNIWNYLVIKGIPGNPEELEMFLHQNFEHICKTFHSPEDIFIFDQHDPLESQRLFLDGKLLFYMTFRLSLSLTTPDLPVETVWLEPETGKRLSTLSTCLGISTSSGNREIATEFIDYVLSEKVQKKISETYAAGIRKSVIDIPIPENKYTYDNAGIANFIIFQIRDLYKKVANGTMSAEEATQKALERYI